MGGSQSGYGILEVAPVTKMWHLAPHIHSSLTSTFEGSHNKTLHHFLTEHYHLNTITSLYVALAHINSLSLAQSFNRVKFTRFQMHIQNPLLYHFKSSIDDLKQLIRFSF